MPKDKSIIQGELEKALEQGVKDGKIPHAIVYATNRDGSFQYSFATGNQNYGLDSTPIGKDAVLQLASQTKLLTAIVALQAVEQGVLGLDDDVTVHIPEIAKFGIIEGFKGDGEPTIEDRKKPITLRHLLTHSSGTSYAFGPKIMQWQQHNGTMGLFHAPTVLENYAYPMVAEAGDSWMYSPGLDWTGLLLERLTGHDLETLFQTGICKPLDIPTEELTFWPQKNKSSSQAAANIPQLTTRKPDGSLAPNFDATLNTNSTAAFGGHGGHAQLGAYLKVLSSLLRNDAKLLPPALADQLFTPQLAPPSRAALQAFLHATVPLMPGEIDPATPVDYGLGGMVFLTEDSANGRRKPGTLSWGGMFNSFWAVDREAGLAWTFGTQVVPPGDPGTKEMCGVAERAIYGMAGVEF